MQTVILAIESLKEGIFEAADGRWTFLSNVGESLPDFRQRIVLYFMHHAQDVDLFFKHG